MIQAQPVMDDLQRLAVSLTRNARVMAAAGNVAVMGVHDTQRKIEEMVWEGQQTYWAGTGHTGPVSRPFKMGAVIGSGELRGIWDPAMVRVLVTVDEDKVELADLPIGAYVWGDKHKKIFTTMSGREFKWKRGLRHIAENTNSVYSEQRLKTISCFYNVYDDFHHHPAFFRVGDDAARLICHPFFFQATPPKEQNALADALGKLRYAPDDDLDGFEDKVVHCMDKCNERLRSHISTVVITDSQRCALDLHAAKGIGNSPAAYWSQTMIECGQQLIEADANEDSLVDFREDLANMINNCHEKLTLRTDMCPASRNAIAYLLREEVPAAQAFDGE